MRNSFQELKKTCGSLVSNTFSKSFFIVRPDSFPYQLQYKKYFQ